VRRLSECALRIIYPGQQEAGAALSKHAGHESPRRGSSHEHRI